MFYRNTTNIDKKSSKTKFLKLYKTKYIKNLAHNF